MFGSAARGYRGGLRQRAPDIGTVWVYVPVGPSGEAVVNCLRRTRNFRFSSYIDVAVEGDLE